MFLCDFLPLLSWGHTFLLLISHFLLPRVLFFTLFLYYLISLWFLFFDLYNFTIYSPLLIFISEIFHFVAYAVFSMSSFTPSTAVVSQNILTLIFLISSHSNSDSLLHVLIAASSFILNLADLVAILLVGIFIIFFCVLTNLSIYCLIHFVLSILLLWFVFTCYYFFLFLCFISWLQLLPSFCLCFFLSFLFDWLLLPFLVYLFHAISFLCLKSGSCLPLPKKFLLFTSMIGLQNDEKFFFYFILKALFILKVFKFLSELFGHAEKWQD